MAIPFDEHCIRATASSRQGRSDPPGPASYNKHIHLSADFNVSGRFCNRFPGGNGVHSKNLPLGDGIHWTCVDLQLNQGVDRNFDVVRTFVGGREVWVNSGAQADV